MSWSERSAFKATLWLVGQGNESSVFGRERQLIEVCLGSATVCCLNPFESNWGCDERLKGFCVCRVFHDGQSIWFEYYIRVLVIFSSNLIFDFKFGHVIPTLILLAILFLDLKYAWFEDLFMVSGLTVDSHDLKMQICEMTRHKSFRMISNWFIYLLAHRFQLQNRRLR